jgi:hypothetical protein
LKIVHTEIRGLSALLQHRFGEQAEVEEATRAQLIRNGTPREQAEATVYRDHGGCCYFPGAAIARMLREAGGGHKLRGSRKAVKWVVPAAVIVVEEAISILDANGKPVDDFEVDSRPVTIPATKGRIMRHRPRWDEWQAAFTLEVDESVLPVDLVHQLLEEGGRRIGIGDFRPEKGGSFGRFEVTAWTTATHE